MDILKLPDVTAWLDQFDVIDRYVATHLLRKLRYVSFQKFESWIQSSVFELIGEIDQRHGREPIAIFPVTKPSFHSFNSEKEKKPTNDSAGRISHALRNFERLQNLRRVELTPRIVSMKEKRIRHVIFVDDFIGTGTRFRKFWRDAVPKEIKSWQSLGWCTIWLVAYAGHRQGVSHICDRISGIDQHHVRVELPILRSPLLDNPSLLQLFKKYSCSRSLGGFGEQCSPIIFQHGCPNNAPNMLWRPENNAQGNWTPLFPNRAIPNGLYPLFETDQSVDASPEELWMVKHYELALGFLERLTDFRRNHGVIAILGMLDKHKSLPKIRNALLLSNTEFNTHLELLRVYGYVDSDNNITNFGKELLLRISKPKIIKKQSTDALELQVDHSNYYPSSYMGIQRDL